MERRKQPRARCRATVELHCPGNAAPLRCRVRDIGLGGLFAIGQPAVTIGAAVEIRLSLGDRELSVPGAVARQTLDGVGISFGALSAAQAGLIQALMAPRWDGRDILEGIMILAATAEIRNLTDWLRLTSIADTLRRRVQYSA